MKKVKVQYMAGTGLLIAELENVHHWETMEDNSITLYADEDEQEEIAEFTNVVAVMRMSDGN